MNEKEIRENYPPRKCENQLEFDALMHQYNESQAKANHPYLDRERELNKQKALLETQMQAIRVQLNTIKVERLEIEQQRKNINRMFHDLKHELIVMNPKCMTKKTEDTQS